MGIHNSEDRSESIIKNLFEYVGRSPDEAQCKVDQHSAQEKLDELQGEIESLESKFKEFLENDLKEQGYRKQLEAYQKQSAELRDQLIKLETVLSGECVKIHWDIAPVPNGLSAAANVTKTAQASRGWFRTPSFLLSATQKQLRASHTSLKMVDDMSAALYAGKPLLSNTDKWKLAIGGILLGGGAAVAAWNYFFGEETPPVNPWDHPKPIHPGPFDSGTEHLPKEMVAEGETPKKQMVTEENTADEKLKEKPKEVEYKRDGVDVPLDQPIKIVVPSDFVKVPDDIVNPKQAISEENDKAQDDDSQRRPENGQGPQREGDVDRDAWDRLRFNIPRGDGVGPHGWRGGDSSGGGGFTILSGLSDPTEITCPLPPIRLPEDKKNKK